MRGGVVLEVAQRGVDLVFLSPDERVLPGGGHDAVDVAVVEVFQAGGEPLVLMVAQHELQLAGEVVQVLAGVEQVHDLGGLRELGGGDSPDLIPVTRLSRRLMWSRCAQCLSGQAWRDSFGCFGSVGRAFREAILNTSSHGR
jgi:hypothetical protein